MIQIPNTREELQKLEKENNVIVKINSNGKLNGLVPAYRKISKFIGHLEKWQITYVASKQYHALLDINIKSNISYDLMMGSVKSDYTDSFGRIAKVFTNEKDAIDYLIN